VEPAHDDQTPQPVASQPAPTGAIHPIWPRFRQYLLQRLKTSVATSDVMCDFYFTQMETQLNSDAAARELAAGLLRTAYDATFDHLQWAQGRAKDATTRDAISLALISAKTLAFEYAELDARTSRTVSWNQTRIRLTTRRHLDGVAALLQNHQEVVIRAGFKQSSDVVLVDAIIKRVAAVWADRHVDDTTPRMTIAPKHVGGAVIDLGSGVHALTVTTRLEMNDGVPDLDENGEVVPETYAYSRRQATSDTRGANVESHRVGVLHAREFCEVYVREISEGPLTESISVDHPTWAHGFYVDNTGRLQVLPERLDTLPTVNVEFEECALVKGRGRSCDLAYFVASVIITLGTRVDVAITGQIGAIDSAMAVLAVGGVNHKLAAAEEAGIPAAVIPRRKSRSAEKNTPTPSGVAVLEVDTPLEALWCIFELGTTTG
jgi:hypothetical protein